MKPSFTPRNSESLEGVIREVNNNMSGLKTDPVKLNTSPNGEGLYRTSVIDYVKELNKYPDDIVDKGKGVDPAPNILDRINEKTELFKEKVERFKMFGQEILKKK